MKQSKPILSVTICLLLVLLACVFLMIGAAWARYQTKNSQIFSYEQKDYSFVYLWHSYDEETDTFQSQPSTWQTEGDQRTLNFCVSNGTTESCAQDDQRVRIRLLVSLGAWGGVEEMDATLNLPQTGESFQGSAQPIAENSPICSTFGEGWVIIFCDEEGQEAGWTLNGPELSYLEGQITVQNVELQDTTLMQLQVIGDPSV